MPEETNRIVADRSVGALLPALRRGDREPARRGGGGVADEVRRQHDDRHPGRARRTGSASAARPRRSASSPGATCSSRCTGRRSSTGRCSAEAMRRLSEVGARAAGRLPGPPAHPQDARRRLLPRRHPDRPGRLPRLPLARGRRRRRPHRLRRDPGGDDLPRDPVLHAARQHRAAGDGPGRHQHAARPRPGADRGDTGAAAIPPAASRAGPRRRAEAPERPDLWDGRAAERVADVLADW